MQQCLALKHRYQRNETKHSVRKWRTNACISQFLYAIRAYFNSSLNCMIKKISLALFVVVLTGIQAFFIYALQDGGAEQFRDVWADFDVSQTEYSKFVFNSIQWWWSLPALSLTFLASALKRPTILRMALAIATSLIGTFALLWAVYSPALMIKLG